LRPLGGISAEESAWIISQELSEIDAGLWPVRAQKMAWQFQEWLEADSDDEVQPDRLIEQRQLPVGFPALHRVVNRDSVPIFSDLSPPDYLCSVKRRVELNLDGDTLWVSVAHQLVPASRNGWPGPVRSPL
jgi:hypothetical protein